MATPLPYSQPVVTQVQGYNPNSTFTLNVEDVVVDPATIAAFAVVIFDANSGSEDFTNVNIPLTEVTQSGSNYILYVNAPDALCNDNNYVIVRIIYSDGSVTQYSEPTLIFTPPPSPTIAIAYKINAGEDGIVYITDFCEPDAELGTTYKFNIAIQYTDASGNLHFDVQENLVPDYETILGTPYAIVTVDLTPAFGETVKVAAQQVLVYNDGEEDQFASNSSFGNTYTISAEPTPFPPTNVTDVYNCDGTTTFTWDSPIEPDDFVITDFNIWRRVQGEEEWVLAHAFSVTQPLDPSYSYVYTNDNSEFGEQMEYSITTYGHAVSSSTYTNSEYAMASPSPILIVAPSGIPLNLEGIGNNGEVIVLWQNPADIGGGTGEHFVLDLYRTSPPALLDTVNVPYVAELAQYQYIFTGLLNTLSYHVTIKLITSSEDCAEVQGAETDTGNVTPVGAPILFDVDVADCGITFKVFTNNGTTEFIPGSNAVIRVEAPESVFFNQVFSFGPFGDTDFPSTWGAINSLPDNTYEGTVTGLISLFGEVDMNYTVQAIPNEYGFHLGSTYQITMTLVGELCILGATISMGNAGGIALALEGSMNEPV